MLAAAARVSEFVRQPKGRTPLSPKQRCEWRLRPAKMTEPHSDPARLHRARLRGDCPVASPCVVLASGGPIAARTPGVVAIRQQFVQVFFLFVHAFGPRFWSEGGSQVGWLSG